MSAASISAMASGSIFLTGAIVALETGTAAGVSMSWNPIGWTTLAIVAVAAVVVVSAVVIYHYWDDICDFFSSIGNSIVEVAKVVWEYVTVPPTVYPPSAAEEVLPPPTISPPIVAPMTKTSEKVETDTKTKAIPREEEVELKNQNVYDLHIGVTMTKMRVYTYGQVWYDKKTMFLGDIWKYGTTAMNSVYWRYAKFFRVAKDKERYIFNCFKNGALLPYQWYLYRVTKPIALAEEKRLILDYSFSHGGNYPPGNTWLR